MAAKEPGLCPKCTHPITNPIECESCGIVFKKFLQAEARKKEETPPVITISAPSGNRKAIALLSLLLVVAIAAAVFFARRSYSPPASLENTPEIIVENGNGTPLKSEPIPMENLQDTSQPKPGRLQLALKSTVSVRTPWGAIGSGFFVGENSVITNKHVITFDDKTYENFKSIVERNRELIELETAKINDYRNKIQKLPSGPNKSQWEIVLKNREKSLEIALESHRKNEEKLRELRDKKNSRAVKIVTSDNSEYPVDGIIESPSHDLALLKVYSVSGVVLKPDPSPQRLTQGQVVYTIGSPMGLTNTMTSGIFSAYRKMVETGQIYLQFDAAINPGNSGGPLIDNRGNVLGVNTMIMNRTEGIGFAIPFDVVQEDFSSSL
jgi:S1-C subfamily serine protease